LWLILALSGPCQALPTPPVRVDAADVSALRVTASRTVAELDLSKLKGDLREVAWSPEGGRLYIQTAEGRAPATRLRHYWVAIDGGAVLAVDAQPDWAGAYWAFKSDRAAPGLGGVMIDVDQKVENLKFGTGSAGAADRASNGLGADNINVGSNLEKAAESQRVNVVRLTLYGETISEFQNEQPVPGLMFGWGPENSGAIAFTDRDGRLTLLDRRKHRQTVPGAHDALLPAWSADGARLAWVQKSGRRKFTLVYADVAR
jgi:hypothetical protein